MPFEFKSPIHGMKINRLIFQTVGVLDLQLLPACQLSAVHLSLDLLDLLSVLLQQEVFLAFQLFLQFLFQSILSLYDLLSAPFIVLFCLNVEVLLSEFEVRTAGEVWLYAAPSTGRHSIPVRLGQGGFGDKFTRLHAFWYQTVLANPNKTYNQIDLRFSSQVVTREN